MCLQREDLAKFLCLLHMIIICSDTMVSMTVCQELWRIVVHTLEKTVVLPPLADPRAVRRTFFI